MQKNYVVKKAVHLSGGYGPTGKNVEGFLTRPGDVLVFDAQNNNNLTIYRSEEIAKVLPRQSSISIEALVKGGFFEEIRPKAPEPPPVVVPPPAPVVVEAPAPVEVVKQPDPVVPAPVIEKKPEAPKPAPKPKVEKPKPVEKPEAPPTDTEL